MNELNKERLEKGMPLINDYDINNIHFKKKSLLEKVNTLQKKKRFSIEQKNTLAIFECYQKLFEMAEPPADFIQLVINGKIVDGAIKIPFYEHTINEKVFYSITDYIAKKYKFNKREKCRLNTTILLGCSPKTEKA